MQSENYYEILGVGNDKSLVHDEVVKKAYKKLAVVYHPDKYKKGTYDDTAKNKWLIVIL